MKKNILFLVMLNCFFISVKALESVSIQQFGVKPGNSAAENTKNLQKAIDWASEKGAALFVEPSDEPYAVDGGIILKKNVSLVGVHGPTPRGTVHLSKKQPVGSVFKITDNAQLIDLFTFGSYGGILLDSESYGQLTNFNFDCVAVGIHKKGSNSKNRNWQIAQGSIIANCCEKVENVHPIIIEGEGYTALSNVEAFSGGNGALTTVPENQSRDFLLIRGNKKLTVSIVGSRMRNYVSDQPITIENKLAVVQAVACVDKKENLYNQVFEGK